MLKEALAKVGILPEDTEFSIAITKYLNAGGTIERAHSLLDAAAERMSGMGQTGTAADRSQTSIAQTRQPVEDARGQAAIANGQTANASPSSFNRDGRGPIHSAGNGRERLASPVREPHVRGLAAKIVIANSVFDRVKTSDGRAWGNVGAHELDGMSRDGAMANAIKNHLGPLTNAQRFKKIRELMNEKTFEQIKDGLNAA